MLALLAVLPIALSIFTSPGPSLSAAEEPVIPSPAQSIVVVTITLVLTAVAVGFLGGFVWRRLRVTGATVSLVSAWLVGALLLPLVAVALGVELRTAYTCFDTCSPALDSAQPTAALGLVLIGMVLAVVTVIGGVIASVLAVAGIVLAVRNRTTAAIVCLAAAFGALNWLAFVTAVGALVTYLCLALGVVAWSAWLSQRRGATEPQVNAADLRADQLS